MTQTHTIEKRTEKKKEGEREEKYTGC